MSSDNARANHKANRSIISFLKYLVTTVEVGNAGFFETMHYQEVPDDSALLDSSIIKT